MKAKVKRSRTPRLTPTEAREPRAPDPGRLARRGSTGLVERAPIGRRGSSGWADDPA